MAGNYKNSRFFVIFEGFFKENYKPAYDVHQINWGY